MRTHTWAHTNETERREKQRPKAYEEELRNCQFIGLEISS
jgi:hypothetical protein